MQKPLVAVISQGCAANFGDGEKVARLLSANYRVAFSIPKDEEPEAFYLNVCTVKGNAGALKLIRESHDAYPGAHIFLLGCTPKDFQKDASALLSSVRFTTAKELESRLGSSAEIFNTQTCALRSSPFIGIVNIEEGCLDACAFCSTHLVKGRLRSNPAQAIVEQVRGLVYDGCKEIQLTGQDCACYGFDTGTNLAELVQNILVHVPGDYKIRLGMGNPRHVFPYLEPLLECFADERVYKFVHLPVQSGSERILKAMNRKHTVSDYAELVHAFKKHFERFTISTDMIVGYPGETNEDFNDTMNLLKETKPTVCNITRFVPRPQTVAHALNTTAMVDDNIKHNRSAALAQTFQEIAQQNNLRWVGYEGFVVVEKNGHRQGTTIARNEAYNPVALQGRYEPGTKLKVRITGAEPFALIAEPV